MNSRRERKRRLVYLFWAVVAGLVILGALPTFIGARWPRPLADDSVYLMVHQSFRTELWRFELTRTAEPERHPWVGQMLLVPPVHRVLNPSPGALWELTSTADPLSYALVKRRLPSLTEELRVPIDRPMYGVVVVPDGQQFQLLVQNGSDESTLNMASQIAWVDATGRGVRQSPSHCDPFPHLLPPLRADEALLLCASELWAVRPDGERPLLTTKMEGSPCYRYAGRPFGVGRDPERQRLLVTRTGAPSARSTCALTAPRRVQPSRSRSLSGSRWTACSSPPPPTCSTSAPRPGTGPASRSSLGSWPGI
jgi:hypothetical protein